jgi:hypothetical protein
MALKVGRSLGRGILGARPGEGEAVASRRIPQEVRGVALSVPGGMLHQGPVRVLGGVRIPGVVPAGPWHLSASTVQYSAARAPVLVIRGMI